MPSVFTRAVAIAPWWPVIALLAIGSLACVHLLAIPVFEDEGSQIRWIVRIIEAGEWLGPMGEGKPLEAWPMVPFVRLGLPAIVVMRALHVLAGAIGAALVYRIALRVLDWRAAFVAGILFAICPFVVYLQRFALSDSFVCLAALTVWLSLLRFIERTHWRDAILLSTGLVLGALSKLPVGFVLVIATPLALILMPAASRQDLLRAPGRTRLLAAHVPVLLLAVLIVAIACARVRRGQSPGFGLADFLGVGLGRYRGIGAATGAVRMTLPGELAAQLSWPVTVIGAAGIAAGACRGDWRLRWLAASGLLPLLAIATLASFWFSRYLLFTLPPLIIVAVAGWSALAARAGRSSRRLARTFAQAALAALCIACMVLMGRQSALIVLDPTAASWSPVDRFQYFEGWSSGYGYPEAAAFLLAAPAVPANVFALDGHSAYQLRSYLPRAWIARVNNLDYGPDGRPLRTTRERLENLLRVEPAWIIIPEPLLQRYLDASFGESSHPDLQLIAAFDKPGARTRLAIYRVTEGSTSGPRSSDIGNASAPELRVLQPCATGWTLTPSTMRVPLPIWLLLSLGLTPALAPAADLYRLTSTNTRITFAVRALGLTWVSAHFNDFSGELVPDRRAQPSRVDVTITTASLACESARWNARLLSPVWFDAQQYPQIVYHSERVRFDGEGGGTVSGQLTLHGHTHALELTVNRWDCANQPGVADTCSFDAEGRIRRSDFGLPHGILEAGDEVVIDIRGNAIKG